MEPSLMKAWQFTNTHEPLVLNEVPEPTAAPGHVVVDIKSAARVSPTSASWKTRDGCLR